MRSNHLLAGLTALCLIAGTASAGVVIDMPAPPPVKATATTTATATTAPASEAAPTVGEIALYRYASTRTGPRNVTGGIMAWHHAFGNERIT